MRYSYHLVVLIFLLSCGGSKDNPTPVSSARSITTSTKQVDCSQFSIKDVQRLESSNLFAYPSRGVASLQRIISEVGGHLKSLATPADDKGAGLVLWLNIINNPAALQSILEKFPETKNKIKMSDVKQQKDVYCLLEYYISEANASQERHDKEIAKRLAKSCKDELLESDHDNYALGANCRHEYMQLYLAFKDLTN